MKDHATSSSAPSRLARSAGPEFRYTKEFWREENLKFARPHYRMQRAARIINRRMGGTDCTLLDLGCGPAALRRLLAPGISYYGMDIAIQEPGPNLVEADFLAAPIKFADRRFDAVVALGIFEYMADRQQQKLGEIAHLLSDGGLFLISYWNFGHRRPEISRPFSNVQPVGDFRADLERNFQIDKIVPVSHNWHHSSPNRRLVQVLNDCITFNIPIASPMLAIEYFFICSKRN